MSTTILTVGSSGTYATIGAAVAAADQDTDPTHCYDIELTPGTYTNGFANVTRPMSIEVDPANFGTEPAAERDGHHPDVGEAHRTRLDV